MFTHCVVTAAVIHLVTLSPPDIPPEIREQAEIHVANAILALHEMYRSFPIVARYLKSIRVLVSRWCPTIPQRIQEAMVDVGMGSPMPTSLSPPNPNPQPYTSHADHIHHANQPIINDHTHPPIPEQNQTCSQLHNYQPSLWTPFPHVGGGVPLALPPNPNDSISQHLGITGMPTPETALDWSEMNRYGFTMGGAGDGGMALWELTWDNYSSL